LGYLGSCLLGHERELQARRVHGCIFLGVLRVAAQKLFIFDAPLGRCMIVHQSMPLPHVLFKHLGIESPLKIFARLDLCGLVQLVLCLVDDVYISENSPDFYVLSTAVRLGT